MEKKLNRIDSYTAELIDVKPPRKDRPKCLQCDKTVLLYKTWWYESPVPRKERSPKYMYVGEGYFCCRNCALAYAHKKATEELGIPKFQ